MRQTADAELNFDVAFFGDLVGSIKRIQIVRQSSCHLVVRFQIEFVAVHAHAVRLIHVSLRLDAQKNVLRFRILFIDVMYIICCDRFDADLFGKLPEFRKDLFLFGYSVILKLDIKIVTENVFQHARDLIRTRILPAQEGLRYISRKAGRQTNKALMMRL